VLSGVPATWWLEEAAAARAVVDGAAGLNEWNNASGDGLWGTAANWSLGHPPGERECALFDRGGSNCRARRGGVSPKLAGLVTTPRYGGQVLLEAGFAEGGRQTLELSGGLCLMSGRLTVSGLVKGRGRSAKGTGVTIRAASVRIGRRAKLEADHRGFDQKQGPGWHHASHSRGASHGGRAGGTKPDPPYGSAEEPVTLGGGGEVTRGGGAIRLVASGTIRLDGRVSANGEPAIGGGAGGSIWIACDRFEGLGLLQANGGNGGWAGGGGGRVAVYFNEESFTGTIEAKGGTSEHKCPGKDGSIVSRKRQ
jgi:hypothetical protein